MMGLIFRNERRRLAEVQAATGQVRSGCGGAVTASNLKLIPSIRTREFAELSERSAQRTALPALASPARAVNFTRPDCARS